MGRDDYHVITYRLLKYLYECLKKSKPVAREVLEADFFKIDEAYWEYILRHLYTDGYIEGVALVPILNKVGGSIKILPHIAITPKGIEYLQENSLFQKIKGTVKEIAEILPA